MSERCGMLDDPFWHVTQIINTSEYRSVKRLSNYIKNATAQANPAESDLSSLQQCVRDRNTTRFKTYRELINPELVTHPIYNTDSVVNDSLRIKFTRLRLSSHCLRIEIDRWKNAARDTRVCSCDGVSIQDEPHIFQCQLTADIRRDFGCENMTLNSFFNEVNPRTLLMLSKCLDVLEP